MQGYSVRICIVLLQRGFTVLFFLLAVLFYYIVIANGIVFLLCFCIIVFLLCFLFLCNRRRRIQAMWWLLMTVFCLYVAGEEISWGERLTGFGFDLLREVNAQGESNLHNLEGVQNYLHASFMAAGVFLGWLGWRFFPAIEAFPARRFSLYFLIVAAFYFYWDVSWISHGDRIRNDQEAIELLMGVGLLMHGFTSLRRLLRPRSTSPG